LGLDFLTWCTYISAPICLPPECPEGTKVSLKETEQLKTPDETFAPFKGRSKGVSLSDPIYLSLVHVQNYCKIDT
jgi:hypothetical protein